MQAESRVAFFGPISHGMRNEVALCSNMQEFHVFTIHTLVVDHVRRFHATVIELEHIPPLLSCFEKAEVFHHLPPTDEGIERFGEAASGT